jgi:hypothetical protein
VTKKIKCKHTEYGIIFDGFEEDVDLTNSNSNSNDLNLGTPNLDLIAAMWTGDSEELIKQLKIYKIQKEKFEEEWKTAFINWLEKRKKYDN